VIGASETHVSCDQGLGQFAGKPSSLHRGFIFPENQHLGAQRTQGQVWALGKFAGAAKTKCHKLGGLNQQKCLAPVAHAYNPSYLGGRDQEGCGSKPAWANSS
jgi:hypothetical protein